MTWLWQKKPFILCAVGAEWGKDTVADIIEALPDYDIGAVQTEAELITLAETRPAWIFFLNWSYKVPDSVLNAAPCVNFHCTPLPYGRGGGPIENMIRVCEERRVPPETVITAHVMTRELDAGPIYGQSEPISLAGTKAEILSRFSAPVAELLIKIVRCELSPQPQVGEPTRFHRLKKSDYDAFWLARGGNA